MTLPARLRLLLALVVTIAAGLVGEPRPQPLGTATPIVPEDPATAKSEYLKGIRLAEEGHHLASLRSLERARFYAAGVLWEFHFNVAAGHYNSTIERRSAAGHSILVSRSSIERVASVRRALEESEQAERLATTSQDRSTVLLGRSQMLRHWGLAWEGLELIRQAQAADPRSERAGAQLKEYTEAVRHPGSAGAPGEAGVTVVPPHAQGGQ